MTTKGSGGKAKRPALSSKSWRFSVVVDTEGGGWSTLCTKPIPWKQARELARAYRETGHQVAVASVDGSDLPS